IQVQGAGGYNRTRSGLGAATTENGGDHSPYGKRGGGGRPSRSRGARQGSSSSSSCFWKNKRSRHGRLSPDQEIGPGWHGRRLSGSSAQSGPPGRSQGPISWSGDNRP